MQELSGGISRTFDNFCREKLSLEKIDVIKKIVHFFPMKFSPINYINVSLCKKISLVMKAKSKTPQKNTATENKKRQALALQVIFLPLKDAFFTFSADFKIDKNQYNLF